MLIGFFAGFFVLRTDYYIIYKIFIHQIMLLKLYRTFTVSLAIAATASAINLESEDQSWEGYENDDVQTLAETYGESVVMKPLS